jgi:hypothetical protein
MTAEADMSFIAMAGAAGLGVATASMTRTIHAIEHERRAITASLEGKIEQRLRELEANASTFSLDYFEARLEQEVGRARRYGLPLSVIFLEVGIAGIAEGPAIVEAGARLLRTEDTFAPVGRGEYAFFLPQTNEVGARVVIARLAEALKEFQPLFGIATLSPNCTDAKSLLASARGNAHRHLIARTWNESGAVS